MVSQGRASRNCAKCRAVKRRCDQQVPHCGQCVRLREECPGYRDEWDLVFRDQTNHTIKRSREKWAKSITSTKAHDHLPPPARKLAPSVDEIGVNHFLRHFVIGDQSSERGVLNYVPSVYRADGEHSTLMASMAAVGLVALANSTQRPELASQARAKYSEAVRDVSIALASPVESVKDSTLMSVISLGVFAHVSGYESWVRHVQGAAALVVARGKSQFSSPVAIRMFAQVRADLAVTCLHSTQAFPKDMLELQEEAAKYTDSSNPTWLMGVLGTRCVDLLMNIRNNYFTAEPPWLESLEEATAIERDLEYVAKALTIQELYTTVREPDGDTNIIHHGRYDLYQDPWSIRLWNNYRNLRMILSEILCYLLNTVLATELPPAVRQDKELKLQATMRKLSNLADDILATVPQALGFISPAAGPCSSFDLASSGNVSGGYMLTWCLYMVGKCVVTKSDTRKWIIRHLRHIGENAGISIALQLLEDIVKIDQWAG